MKPVLPVRFDGIPLDMRRESGRWGVWHFESRSDKPTKVPYSVRTQRPAASTRPDEWCDFPEAAAYLLRMRNMDGLGFRLGEGWAGVDLDGCVDTETGEIHPWASAIVERLNSYTEVSPSGTGLKIFLVAEAESARHKTTDVPIKAIEVYTTGRYFTVTGHHLGSTPLDFGERTPELTALYKDLFPIAEPQPRAMPLPLPSLEDNQVIAKMMGAKNGGGIWTLWKGDYSAYGSKSEADLALVSHISFYVGRNPARIDAIFRQSELYRPKWDEKHGAETYGAMTIAKVLSEAREFYRPHAAASGVHSGGLNWWRSLSPA